MERDTSQRRAIRETFERQARPLSPQEVLSSAQELTEGLGIATVYRTIKALVDECWLALVELPGQATRYELAGQAHHHHFSCRSCRRVYDIPGCSGHLHAHVPADFEVESHEVVVYGRCGACRQPAAERAVKTRRKPAAERAVKTRRKPAKPRQGSNG